MAALRPAGARAAETHPAARASWTRSASVRPIPGTAAICSTGRPATRFAEPNVREQRALPRGPDPGQVVERRRVWRLPAQVAVVGDREAVRLVAEALDQVERRRAGRQDDRLGTAGEEQLLALLGQADDAGCPPARAPPGPPRRRSAGPCRRRSRSGPGSAQRSSSALPSSPAFARWSRRRSISAWLAKSSWPATSRIRNRRYSPAARLALLEDDHAADRLASLDRADVVALDPHRRGRQAQRGRQLLERHERPAVVGEPARLLAGQRLRRRSGRPAPPGAASRRAAAPAAGRAARAAPPGTPPGRPRRPAASAARIAGGTDEARA